jgi:CRP/FNR family cyclic AMP-dependent transcriptional regulator
MVAIKRQRKQRGHSLAVTITPEELIREMPHSKIVSYAVNELVFREGALARDCCLIMRGRVQIIKKSQAGGDVPLAVAKAGEFLGEMAMISGEKRSASAVAMTKVEAVIIRHTDFEALLKAKHPFAARLSLQFSALLAARCQQLLELISQQKKKSSPLEEKSRKPLDVRTVFNRVYTLWAV